MLRRRLSIRFFAVAVAFAVAAAYATAGEGRAVAGAGSWDAGVDTPVLAPAGRTSLRSGRPSDGAPVARAPFAALPVQPCGALSGRSRPFGVPSPLAGHPSVLLETSRSSRGPPAPPSA